jgi:hypothetical protein
MPRRPPLSKPGSRACQRALPFSYSELIVTETLTDAAGHGQQSRIKSGPFID